MAKRQVIVLLSTLLPASAAINIFLLLRDRLSSGHAQIEREPANASGRRDRILDRRADTLSVEKKVTSLRGELSTSPDMAQQSCETQLTAARGELEAVFAKLEREGPDRLRFERGVPDPRSADRLKPELQRLFSRDGGTVHWTVECRSQTCKLQLLVPSGEWNNWTETLQKDDGIRRMSKGMGFSGGGPTYDPISGQAFDEQEIYVRVADEGEDMLARLNVARQLAEQFRASDSIRACTNNFQEKGTLEALISVSENGFDYRFGGTLGATPGGRCIAERLREMGSSIKIPEKTRSASAYQVFRSPPE
jgi:hypothetical protein